jgi:hypothetical protein
MSGRLVSGAKSERGDRDKILEKLARLEELHRKNEEDLKNKKIR